MMDAGASMKRETQLILSYTGFGLAFGALFPVVSLAVDLWFNPRPGPVSLLVLLRANPVQMIVLLAPLVLGVTFFILGVMRANLVRQLDKTRDAERTLWRIANQDSLTGMGSRHRLMADLDHALTGQTEIAAPLHVLLLDLNKFKFVNDTLGHNVGDALLVALSQRIGRLLLPGQSLYRLGGDEFVILDTAAGDAGIADFATGIIDSLAQPFEIDDNRIMTGANIGICALRGSDTKATDVLGRADLALYAGKQMQGSNVVFFADDMAVEANSRAVLEDSIRRGIANGEFFLEYQPIVDARTCRVTSLEALVRWQDPVSGRVMPDRFIAAAEASGLIGPLGLHILRRACEQALDWPQVSVSVNVSVEQIRSPAFPDAVLAILRETGFSPARLILEMTESLFAADARLIKQAFTTLQHVGIRFALDDFGTGFSSINHLREFGLDILKIDQSFVRNLRRGGSEAALLSHVLGLGRIFGVSTVIEGVETRDEAELLRASGANGLQGYYFSRPVSAAAVAELLQQEGRPPAADMAWAG